MKTYYARIARGDSFSTIYRGFPVRSFFGLGDSVSVEAENAVDAFLKIYRQLSEEKVEITGLRVGGQDFMLGFSADEWDKISKAEVHIKEALVPENGGIQIQAIRDTPFA